MLRLYAVLILCFFHDARLLRVQSSVLSIVRKIAPNGGPPFSDIINKARAVPRATNEGPLLWFDSGKLLATVISSGPLGFMADPANASGIGPMRWWETSAGALYTYFLSLMFTQFN
jgi:hypothetical protein